MKKIIILLFTLIAFNVNAQIQKDTLINNGLYESLFNYDLHSLMYVK